VVFDEIVLGGEAARARALARGGEEVGARVLGHVEVDGLEEPAPGEASAEVGED
jgi:hypothetical protein